MRGTLRHRCKDRDHPPRDEPCSWQWQILVASNPRKLLAKTVVGTRAEAEQALAETIARLTLRELPTSSDTLGPYLASWLDHQALSVEPSTVISYRAGLRNVPPWLASKKLRDVEPADIRRWVADLSKRGLANSTIHTNLAPVRAAFLQAERDRIILRSPVAGVKVRKRADDDTREVCTPDQVRRLLEAATLYGARESALFHLLALTGARPGEVLALQVGDIDTAAQTVSYRRTVTAGQAAPRAGTKSGKGRTVGIDARTVRAVERWVHELRQKALASGVRWGPKLWLFPREGLPGLPPYRATTWPGVLWRRLAVSLGLPDGGVYVLRHTHASELLHSGVSPDVVAHRLGHSVAMLLSVYGVHLQREDSSAIEVVRRISGGA